MEEHAPDSKKAKRSRRSTYEVQLDRCGKGQCCAHKMLNDLTPQQILILWNGFAAPDRCYPVHIAHEVASLVDRLRPMAEKAIRDLGYDQQGPNLFSLFD